MLSAICFNLDQSKNLLSGNELTFYHITPNFKDRGRRFSYNTFNLFDTKPFFSTVIFPVLSYKSVTDKSDFFFFFSCGKGLNVDFSLSKI